MLGLEAWYMDIPVVTRSYLTAAFLTTAACLLEFIYPLDIYYNYVMIFKEGEWWRLATNFMYFGSDGLDFLFHMFFLSRYCRLLEEGLFRGRPADFVWMLLLGASLMTCAAPFVNIQFMGSALAFMMVYVWARQRDNADISMRFLGLFEFTAPYLPWVLLIFSMLLGSSPTIDLLGICVGHVYYFFTQVYPIITGRSLLKTPLVFTRLIDHYVAHAGAYWASFAAVLSFFWIAL